MQHESGGKQFTSNGLVLLSPTHDRGIMQINDSWIPTATKMGLDLNKTKDNIEFGTWLYQKYGPTQWSTYKQYCKHGIDT